MSIERLVGTIKRDRIEVMYMLAKSNVHLRSGKIIEAESQLVKVTSELEGLKDRFKDSDYTIKKLETQLHYSQQNTEVLSNQILRLQNTKAEIQRKLVKTEYALECQIEKTEILWADLKRAAAGVVYEDCEEQKDFESKAKHDHTKNLTDIVSDHLAETHKPLNT